MKKALVFSGQGSQYVGMFSDLYENNPVAKELADKANEILGYSITNICFNGPIETLKETRYTQPAIFLHSAILKSILEDKLQFDAVAGHSVGEYAALFAADVLSFEDALKLVSLRGQLMFTAGEQNPGTMFAIINLAEDKVEELCKQLTDEGNGNVVVPANYNTVGQLVISGSRDYLREKAHLFKEAGARMVTELVVSGAFHSPLLLPAKAELEKAINSLQFNDAKVPVYSNVFAKPLKKAEEIKEALIMQLTSPVKWTQSVIQMQNDGISEFIELGPGNVLQGLIKRAIKDVEIKGADKLVDLEKFI